MSVVRKTLIVAVAIIGAGILMIIAFLAFRAWTTNVHQSSVAAFYATPEDFSQIPGTLLRWEPLGVDVADAKAYRLLYVTEDQQGKPAVAAGMAFIPDKKVDTPRPMVAFLQGTTGQGDACAPSRSDDPLHEIRNFLPEAMAQGWAVVAPDEYGVGTQGVQLYLIKEQEVRDTVNSIRALRSLPDALTGNDFAVYGYSQGGHSALWTGHLSKQFAPELDLVGVAAAAPAADLTAIIDRQWDSVVGWGIGADVTRSWSIAYPDLPVDPFLTDAARDNFERIAENCTFGSFIEGTIRHDIFRQDFFADNPADNPLWAQALIEQTPPPYSAAVPIMLVQGTADEIVLAGPNANLQVSWCAAGSTVNALWLEGVDHLNVAALAGPAVAGWIADRFAGLTAPNTCSVPPPWSLITVE